MKILPRCISCKHLDAASIDGAQLRCAAFPNGVPAPIASGELRHREAYPGDNGIQYEALEAPTYDYEHPVKVDKAA